MFSASTYAKLQPFETVKDRKSPYSVPPVDLCHIRLQLYQSVVGVDVFIQLLCIGPAWPSSGAIVCWNGGKVYVQHFEPSVKFYTLSWAS